MKKLLLKLLLVFIVILTCVYGCLNISRYKINSPMPDIEYKKAILRDSHNLKYNLEALRPIMGPEELIKFIKENDNNPEIYTPSDENINSGKYRANFHMHTTMSDGMMTVKERMDEAQKYAQNNIKDGHMIIAITDHNTLWGARDVVRLLEEYPNKYNNIKVILGMELNSKYHVSKIITKPIDIHVLVWAINPYDKFLEKTFYNKKLSDWWKPKLFQDFDIVINKMSKYGIVGIAHPARYSEKLKNKKYPYITELFTRYKNMDGKVKFVEGYYQSYKTTDTSKFLGSEYDKYINYINSEAKRLGIIHTGSTDAHGVTIFNYK